MMNFFRGWFGEKKVAFLLWLHLDPALYRRIHNVIIPSDNGTIQIDHILLSPYGVFIIETKNIKGWIFGAVNQQEWTQVLYGHKYYFQNPTRQIFRQKRGLAEFLGLSETSIHAIVYFAGNCTFKTSLPPNVINNGLSSYIKGYQDQVLDPNEIEYFSNRLKGAKSSPENSLDKHLKSLKERYSSNIKCPKCGSRLVERTTKKGLHIGSKFLGCENYPKCKFTKV